MNNIMTTVTKEPAVAAGAKPMQLAGGTMLVSFINAANGHRIHTTLDLTGNFQTLDGKSANAQTLDMEHYYFPQTGNFECILPASLQAPDPCQRFVPSIDRFSFCVTSGLGCLKLPYTSTVLGNASVLVHEAAPSNRPVQGALVSAWLAEPPLTPAEKDALPVVAQTNACGLAAFNGLMVGRVYSFAITPPAGRENNRVQPGGTINHRICCDEDEPLDFTLCPMDANLTWLFVHDGCGPLANLTLHFCGTDGHKHTGFDVSTDQNGLAQLTKTGNFEVTCQGYTFPNLHLPAGMNAIALAGAAPDSMMTISGEVKMARSGNAAPSTKVRVVKNGRVLAEAPTDSLGRYLMAIRRHEIAGAHLQAGGKSYPLFTGGPATLRVLEPAVKAVDHEG